MAGTGAEILTERLKEVAEAGTRGVTEFLRTNYVSGRAERYRLNPPIEVGETRTCDDDPNLAALGIESLRCVCDDGWIYKYRFYIVNVESIKIFITCGEPDTYSCVCQTLGSHTIDFNSPRPGIHSILVQKLA